MVSFKSQKLEIVWRLLILQMDQFLANVSACDDTDVDYAVEVSRDAFNSGEWSNKHPSET